MDFLHQVLRDFTKYDSPNWLKHVLKGNLFISILCLDQPFILRDQIIKPLNWRKIVGFIGKKTLKLTIYLKLKIVRNSGLT